MTSAIDEICIRTSKEERIVGMDQVPIEVARAVRKMVKPFPERQEPAKHNNSFQPLVQKEMSPVLVSTDPPERILLALLYWNAKESTHSPAQLKTLVTLIREHQGIFACNEYDLRLPKPQTLISNMKRPLSITETPRPLLRLTLGTLFEILDSMHKTEVIQPCHSDWAYAVLLDIKNDGTHRLTIDSQPLDNLTGCIQFPKLSSDNALNTLRKATYFSSIKIAKGFHQIPIDKKSPDQLALVTPIGRWEWRMTPMGLLSTPSAFRAFMQRTLEGLQHCTLIYEDDIVVFTRDFSAHMKALQAVFERLQEFDVKIIRPKSEFCRTSIRCPGSTVSSREIMILRIDLCD